MTRWCLLGVWLAFFGVISGGKEQIQVKQVFTKHGLLNMKLTDNMYILNKFMIVPISWDPKSLTNMYVNVSQSIDSLVRLNTTLNSTLRKGLMEIKSVIKSKTDQDKSFVKNYISAGILKNLTMHSVVTGNRIKKLQTIVSELKSEGKNNFKI